MKNTGGKLFRTDDLERTPLGLLCDLVISCTCSYADLSEFIENKAYDEWRRGNFEAAVAALSRVTVFLEQLENKNEENTRDLADVYLLIAQLYQYADRDRESIDWFLKSISADDGNPLAFHSMGVSYLRCEEIDNAIRCFEQEIALDAGDYATYLELAGLYEQQGKIDIAEKRLDALLERDPENVQGLHALIRHYRKHSPAIDTGLLIKRLLRVKRQCRGIDLVIQSYYLCENKMFDDAHSLLSMLDDHSHPVQRLALAYLLAITKKRRERDAVLAEFRIICRSRQEVIHGHVDAFAAVFGEKIARKISTLLEK
ncbi:MAG: tetratricopeptide repeat protein [Chitinispirillaceae bacterium]|jgi:tetratricopeptide (TPR) repeat protein|nr:tetratricopeptide repeat protein [Chitinispirillaceae bacterium]